MQNGKPTSTVKGKLSLDFAFRVSEHALLKLQKGQLGPLDRLSRPGSNTDSACPSGVFCCPAPFYSFLFQDIC